MGRFAVILFSLLLGMIVYSLVFEKHIEKSKLISEYGPHFYAPIKVAGNQVFNTGTTSSGHGGQGGHSTYGGNGGNGGDAGKPGQDGGFGQLGQNGGPVVIYSMKSGGAGGGGSAPGVIVQSITEEDLKNEFYWDGSVDAKGRPILISEYEREKHLNPNATAGGGSGFTFHRGDPIYDGNGNLIGTAGQ